MCAGFTDTFEREGKAVTEIQARLFALRDEEFAGFQRRLVPKTAAEIIGVRTPELRKLARELSGTAAARDFMAALPHAYFEENNLHGFLIERIKDYGAAVSETERFLPFVDNWATCDQFTPKAFAKHKAELLARIRLWLGSGEDYTVRFGLRLLMNFYLDEDFSPEYLELAAAVRSEEYYVKMMAAWFFATALAKRYDETLPYISGRRLDGWVRAKAIQKALESFRVTDEHKAALRTLRDGEARGNAIK